MRLLNQISLLVSLLSPVLAISPPYCPSKSTGSGDQKKLFQSFVTELYINKNVTGAFDTYVSPTILEHNPMVTTRAQVIQLLSGLLPNVNVNIVHEIFDASSSVGVVHFASTGPGVNNILTAIADFYRFDGSCIVEHWDVVEALPAGATNPNALF